MRMPELPGEAVESNEDATRDGKKQSQEESKGDPRQAAGSTMDRARSTAREVGKDKHKVRDPLQAKPHCHAFT